MGLICMQWTHNDCQHNCKVGAAIRFFGRFSFLVFSEVEFFTFAIRTNNRNFVFWNIFIQFLGSPNFSLQNKISRFDTDASPKSYTTQSTSTISEPGLPQQHLLQDPRSVSSVFCEACWTKGRTRKKQRYSKMEREREIEKVRIDFAYYWICGCHLHGTACLCYWARNRGARRKKQEKMLQERNRGTGHQAMTTGGNKWDLGLELKARWWWPGCCVSHLEF